MHLKINTRTLIAHGKASKHVKLKKQSFQNKRDRLLEFWYVAVHPCNVLSVLRVYLKGSSPN